MAYNADDPKQVKKAKKEAEFNEAIKFDEIRRWLSNPVGRKIIYGYLEMAHIFRTTFIQGSPDASAFAEGERNVGLRLLADIQSASGELYLQMVNEAKNLEK